MEPGGVPTSWRSVTESPVSRTRLSVPHEPLGLRAGQVVLHRAAPVVVGLSPEDGGEPLVGAHDGEVGTEKDETERRLTENRLRGGEVRLDAP